MRVITVNVLANKRSKMVENEFPGINVIRTEEIGSPTPTRGPRRDVIDEINDWIENNWTAAI